MEENNKPKKSFAKKFKTIIILMIIIVTLFLISNVYATSKGYPNIFFMIKEVVTGQEDQNVEGKENLLSDKDITISYSSIEIADGLKIQIQRIVLEENKATLYIYINEPEEANPESEKMPLTYMIYNSNNELIANSKGTLDGYRTYAIETTKAVAGNGKIRLEILDKDLNKLSTIEVDLANKELLVNGETYEIIKLSEAELKKYLGIFCLFCENDSSEVNNYNAKLIDMAIKMNENILHMDDYTQAANVNNVNKMINSFFWEDIAPESGVLETSLFECDEARQVYESRGINWGKGICLEITDISFNNGVYEVKFIYSINGSIFDQEIEELPKRETSVKLTLNEDDSLSKYKMISISEGTPLDNPVTPPVEPIDGDDNGNNNNNDNNNNNNNNNNNDNESTENNVYSDIIDNYKAAMNDSNYSAAYYVNLGLNTAALNQYHEFGNRKMYYAYYDINRDNKDELLIIGERHYEFDVELVVIDVYGRHENGSVERIFYDNTIGTASTLRIYKNGKMYLNGETTNEGTGAISFVELVEVNSGTAYHKIDVNMYYEYDENGNISIYSDHNHTNKLGWKSLEEVFNYYIGNTQEVVFDTLSITEIKY